MKAPARPSVGRPLDGANGAFHSHYDAARARAKTDAPILVVLGGSLVLRRGRRQRTLLLDTREYHVMKSAAHSLIAVYAALCGRVGRALGSTDRRALSRLARILSAARRSLACGGANVAAEVRAAVERAADFLDRVRKAGHVSPRALRAFARATRPVLERLTADASRVQLESLHAAAEQALAMLSEDERRSLEVVVAGDHQARARSLAMQYFQRRFGEERRRETRIAYGERVATVAEALELVGTRRIDRAVAAAFYGDPTRLQQDVLGDAAARILDEMSSGKPSGTTRGPGARAGPSATLR